MGKTIGIALVLVLLANASLAATKHHHKHHKHHHRAHHAAAPSH